MLRIIEAGAFAVEHIILFILIGFAFIFGCVLMLIDRISDWYLHFRPERRHDGSNGW